MQTLRLSVFKYKLDKKTKKCKIENEKRCNLNPVV